MNKDAGCSACGRAVARRNISSGKSRVRHKCPHGRWCIAGGRFADGGWNPGGSRHVIECPECAVIVREGSTNNNEVQS